MILTALLVLALFPMAAGAENPPEGPENAVKTINFTMEGAGGLTVLYGEQSTVVTGTQALGGVPADAEVTIKWNDLPADTYLQNLSVGGEEVT